MSRRKTHSLFVAEEVKQGACNHIIWMAFEGVNKNEGNNFYFDGFLLFGWVC